MLKCAEPGLSGCRVQRALYVELVVTVSSLRPNLSLMPHFEPLADLGSEALSYALHAVAALTLEI